ncbi:aminopeptidase [Defluviitalea phaphyphila]|uniref:aminopeptidase n=1 Tax=Defluviitalea phaphyphila TaxID=1473580 RepID=UPI0007304E54|nr:aminopeptidase [Defluviitalea phaphyphila]
MKTELLKKYARLLVKTGVNIQKNQTLVILAPIETAYFVRIVSEIAYKEGAKDVQIFWKDEESTKIKYLHAPEEAFEEFPSWQKEFYLSYSKKGAAFLHIYAENPEIFKDVNPERIAKYSKVRNTELKEYTERTMNNEHAWCVSSIPTVGWAKKVYPNLSEEEAVEKLWDAILKTVRVDKEDPVSEWEEHKNRLKNIMEFLNNNRFKYLHYKNELGTDLIIELPEKHIWAGGAEFTKDGVAFIANMPTEEVFTLPKKDGVNGKVVSSRPLNYNGNLIENFSLTFKDGRIIDFTAEKGYENLKQLIETDEGSHYLGEVALVPYDSPISNLKTIFYNTLFDENASCHLAIGKAYSPCIKGGEKMTKEELEKEGANDSLVHEDFMVGTRDLEIIGTTFDGKEIPIFKKGNFAF